jgi:hypothetical protein
VTEAELIRALDKLKATMIAVATGGPQIQRVEPEFVAIYNEVDPELRARGIEGGLPYRSLWDWYGRWSQSDLPTYQSRRTFVSDVFAPLVKRVLDKPGQQYEPTGWARVDRTVTEMRTRLAAAKTEEQFQSVGLLGRELLISTAQPIPGANLGRQRPISWPGVNQLTSARPLRGETPAGPYHCNA